MTSETPPTLEDLRRNDVEAALAIFRWFREQGRETPPDMAHMLLMYQDDSDELLRRLDEEERASGKIEAR
jgi:hypothetical protein